MKLIRNFIYNDKKYNIYLNRNIPIFIFDNKKRFISSKVFNEISKSYFKQYVLFDEEDKNNENFYKKFLLMEIIVFLGISLLSSDSKNNMILKNVSSKDGKLLMKNYNIKSSDVKCILKNNYFIDDSIKNDINNFIDYLNEFYPNTNLDKFYYNLSNLRISYVDRINPDYIDNDDKGVNNGCYSIIDNNIEILKNNNKKIKKQVLYHELIHACANCNYNNTTIKYSNSRGNGAEEMFCEYFATRENNTNRISYSWMPYAESILILTDYTFDDYCNGGIELLEEKLNDNKLNGKEIIDFLDELRDKIDLNEEDMSKYSINYKDKLNDICYKKIINKFDDSGYSSMKEYIDSIIKKTPGNAFDFCSWIINNLSVEELNKEKINSDYFKDSIKKNLLFDLGIANINEEINLDDYDIVKINNIWVLTKNGDYVSKSLFEYKGYLDNPTKYNINDKNNLIRDVSRKANNLYSDYFNEINKVITNNFIIKHKINEDLKFNYNDNDGVYFTDKNNKKYFAGDYDDLTEQNNIYDCYYLLKDDLKINPFSCSTYKSRNMLNNKIHEINSSFTIDNEEKAKILIK